MIGIFINSLTSGGAEKIVLTLLEKFRQKNQQTKLLFIEKEQFYEIPPGVNTVYLTQYESLDKGVLKMPYVFICAIRLKKQIKQKQIPIIQSHLLRAAFINVLAKMLGSRHHAQIVIHSRINFAHRPYPYRVFAKWVYRQILHRADSVISICETMKQDLDEYLKLKTHARHWCIYNPHNLAEIEYKAALQATDFIFNDKKKYLVSVGRIVEGKRLDDIIQAFVRVQKDIPNLELLFIGEGHLESELRELTKELGCADTVHFLGYQTNPYPYIAQADIFVLASEWEGLPNIIIESLICKTAVISSDCISGPREILHPSSDLHFKLENQIEQGQYGVLYPVGAVGLLSDAITLLLQNEALRTKYVELGVARTKDFAAEKAVSRYLASFE